MDVLQRNAERQPREADAQDALAERDAMLRALVTATPTPIVVIDANTSVVQLWNPAAEQLFGWSADEVLGRALPFGADDEPQRDLERGDGDVSRFETYRTTRDGDAVPVAVAAASLATREGRRTVLVFEDLRQRGVAEEAGARLAAIIESSDDAIVGKNLDGIVTSWNSGAERIFGYRADEMIGQSILRIVPPDRFGDVSHILAKIGRGERVEHFQSERVRRDGQRIVVSLTVSPIRNAAGVIIGASKIARDITTQKRIEREQQRTLRELSMLYVVGQTVAAELDGERVLQTITDAATDLAGAEFGAFFHNAVDQDGGHYLLQTLSGAAPHLVESLGASRNADLFAPTFAGRGVVRVDDLRADPRYARHEPDRGSPSGHLPVASYLAVPVVSRTGEVFGGLVLGHAEPGMFTAEAERVVIALAAQASVALDNARLYEAEQRARTAAEDASRSKDQFLAMLGHELRNPLSSLRNALTTAALDPQKSARALGIARNSTEQLTRLVDDLLDVTRITQGRVCLRRDIVSVPEIVNRAIESVHPLFEERGIALTVSLPPRHVDVDGDATRLEQVLTNLLTNAAKYTEPGGRVTVTLDQDDGRAVLSVRDTGIGIAPELLPRVFELFVQGEQTLDRTRGGLGIGLTLVKQLVELHGGQVEAHSGGAGCGAEFVIRLPAVSAPHAEAETSSAPRATRRANARVLIVEDNTDAAESLLMLLELLGLRVRAVNDGYAALDAARANPPDVMLIDIGLPGMNGYELAQHIRDDEALRHVTLVALTGYGQEEDRLRAFAAGFDYHLVKPVDIEKVESLVAELAPGRAAMH